MEQLVLGCGSNSFSDVCDVETEMDGFGQSAGSSLTADLILSQSVVSAKRNPLLVAFSTVSSHSDLQITKSMPTGLFL